MRAFKHSSFEVVAILSSIVNASLQNPALLCLHTRAMEGRCMLFLLALQVEIF